MTVASRPAALRRLDAQGTHVLLGGQDGRSLKYYMMRGMVDRALREGLLHPGATVADISPGTGAVALAEVAAERGLQACLYVPGDEALVCRLEALGAEVRTGPPSPEGMRAALQDLARRHAAGEVYWTRQNFSQEASAAYEPLARLVLESGLRPATLIAGLGTGGVLRGFGRVLRAACPDLRIIGVVSASMPGLRPPGMVMDTLGMRDLGTPAMLQEALGAVEIVSADVLDSGPSLQAQSIQPALSTAAASRIVRLMNLHDALIISVDGLDRPPRSH